jgi:hypothetical protein
MIEAALMRSAHLELAAEQDRYLRRRSQAKPAIPG